MTNFMEETMGHLTKTERHRIEQLLRQQKNFQEIAMALNRPRSTIMREVLKHRQESFKTPPQRIPNRCIKRRNCELVRLCPGRRCHRKCSACGNCNIVCKDFQEEVCSKLQNPPYVCNGCSENYRCTLRKYFYIFDAADDEYRNTLVKVRQGINLTEGERILLDQQIHDGIKKGQSVHHILATQRDSFTICEKTVYRYVNAGVIRTKRGDMPRACMMRPRKSKNIDHKVDTKCRIGRNFNDFKQFCSSNPDMAIVEMDSVVGRVGGKVLLTLQFNSCGFMLAFIREANNSQSVIDIFNQLEISLGISVFRKLFPVILTDNGTEFSNPAALEVSPFSKEQRTQIFYCEPYASWQKGHIENNHLNLRRVLEKGSSFDNLTQQDIDLVVSHINSIARKSLNDVPAITLFEAIYGKTILKKLNISLIPAQEVILTPELLK